VLNPVDGADDGMPKRLLLPPPKSDGAGAAVVVEDALPPNKDGVLPNENAPGAGAGRVVAVDEVPPNIDPVEEAPNNPVPPPRPAGAGEIVFVDIEGAGENVNVVFAPHVTLPGAAAAMVACGRGTVLCYCSSVPVVQNVV
jgi:hypothetical protein